MKLKNFEAIKQMPVKNFANMIFHVAKYECQTEAEFEEFLNKDIPTELEESLKEALQNLQCSNSG